MLFLPVVSNTAINMMENNQGDKKVEKNNTMEDEENVYLEDDGSNFNKKGYRYRRHYDDVGKKSCIGKPSAFSRKWLYLLVSVLIVIALLLIGMTSLTSSKLNDQGEKQLL